jgi:hypothetical protein
MYRREFLAAATMGTASLMFGGCGNKLPKSRDLVATAEARRRYLDAMLAELCANGPRPIGSDAFNASLSVIEREMARALPDVRRQPFNYDGWLVTGDVTLTVNGQPISITAAENSSGTPAEGITGVLRATGKPQGQFMIVPPDGGDPIAYIGWVEGIGPKVRPVQSFGLEPGSLPAGVVAEKDAPMLETAASEGATATYIAPIQSGPAESANVVGTLPGKTDDEVLFIAHLDTVYTSPGANDNTASLLMILMLAHAISGARPRQTLRFIATAGHELGYHGSRAYCESRKADGSIASVKHSFDFDSITWGRDITIKTTDAAIREAFTAIDTDLGIDGTPNTQDSDGAVLDNEPYRGTTVNCIYAGSSGYDHFDRVHHQPADDIASVPMDCVEIAFLLFQEYLRRTEGIK